KRAAASRVSRNKKAYWRKGTDVGDVEEGIAKANFDKQNGQASVAQRADDELFVVDREAREDAPDPMENLTHKKKGILERIMKRVDEPIPEPKAASKKPTIPKAKKTIIKRKEPKKIEAAKIDIWTTDLEAKVDLNDPDGARIYKETLKLTRVKQPRTVTDKPSLLRAVALPDAGASYNPDVDDYSEFVTRLVEDEKKVLKKDEKERRRKELAPGQKMCTAEEYRREMMEGLGVLEEEKKEGAEEEEEPVAAAPAADEDVSMEEAAEGGKKGGKKQKKEDRLENEKAAPKTKKQRRKEREVQLAERKKSSMKQVKELEQSVFKVKKLAREVREEEEARESALKIKTEHRAIAKATRRKRHGKGTFEDNMEEFLLAEELPSSMRQINPQGCIVSERFKSYQKRNMIPVPLEEKQWKKKGRLRFKIKEERQSKEIKLGTKLRA
ncbi:hypothetical protein PENTCL1PPCAC_3644, partial [Pristionchus entomophagus]